MERVTFQDPAVRKALESYVLARVNVDRVENREAVSRFKTAEGIPSCTLASPELEPLREFSGYKRGADFIQALETASPPGKPADRGERPSPDEIERLLASLASPDTDAVNSAMRSLSNTELAVAPILSAIEAERAGSEWAATALGWGKWPSAVQPLTELLVRRTARPGARARAARAMEDSKEREFLASLGETLADRTTPREVRLACAAAIRSIASSYGGMVDPERARILLAVLVESDDLDMRSVCLAAILENRAPIDAASFVALLDDTRTTPLFWSPYQDARVCDLAVLGALRALDVEVRGKDGKACDWPFPQGAIDLVRRSCGEGRPR